METPKWVYRWYFFTTIQRQSVGDANLATLGMIPDIL